MKSLAESAHDPRNSGQQGFSALNPGLQKGVPTMTATAAYTNALTFDDVPEPAFHHLRRMSDDAGLFEHARGPIPAREHGYCVDDVSRGLLVVCRQPDPLEELVDLAETYLAFLAHAQGADGTFRNRMGFDRQWHDTPQLGDWWGRALWGLGTAVASGPTPWVRELALTCFQRGVGHRAPWSRSMGFAALGAAEVLAARPADEAAHALLADAAKRIGSPKADAYWPWPEPRLTYGNAVLPEVLIAAGQAADDPGLLDDGLFLLDWLLGTETRDGHLSLTPIGGWGHGEDRNQFDQQPIEAAAMADACARAHAVTGDQRWLDGLGMAVAWFLGDNDSGLVLRDELTGGGRDGLRPRSMNPNQGAESTLALLSTLQHARRLAHGSPSR
jgi:hypothetical protein